MTITFRCPECKGICAFKDIYVGRRARCIRCNQLFIIPQNDGEKAKKYKEKLVDGDVLPGFYRALFLKSSAMLNPLLNAAPWLFVGAISFLNFFILALDTSFTIMIPATGGSFTIYFPYGSVIAGMGWGILFFYYLQIINNTAYDVEILPTIHLSQSEVFMGTLWTILESVFSLVIIAGFAFLPAVAAVIIFEHYKIDEFIFSAIVYVLIGFGAFVFPAMLIVYAMTGYLTSAVRPDNLIKPIVKGFRAYIAVFAIFLLAAACEYYFKGIKQIAAGNGDVYIHSLGHIAAAFIGVFGARAAGLYARHYNCYLP